FCFISSTGDIQPCGYLPLIGGNVRDKPFAEICLIREFQELRDPEKQRANADAVNLKESAEAAKKGLCSIWRLLGGKSHIAYISLSQLFSQLALQSQLLYQAAC
ncbi:MAG: SPASM domain-containing protein, partial [Halobacteria archaeon]